MTITLAVSGCLGWVSHRASARRRPELRASSPGESHRNGVLVSIKRGTPGETWGPGVWASPRRSKGVEGSPSTS
ncbi:MAG: hypothetical protein VX715_06495 [Planctomycetota bacterium]|nr:hypothetical protein [Planctomycetota bacterium]